MTFRNNHGERIEAAFSISDKIQIVALGLSVMGSIVLATVWLTSQISGVSERVTRIETRLEERNQTHP